jgi:hypothetical protein
MARSNIALASAAVPDCWALANPMLHSSAKVANINANLCLVMAFPSHWSTFPRRLYQLNKGKVIIV